MERSDTTSQFIFGLPPPAHATFDFTHHEAIRFTVPAESQWKVPYHWHINGLGCESVSSIGGPLHVYVSSEKASEDKFGSTGMNVGFKPRQEIGWSRSRLQKHTQEPLIAVFIADEKLQRNLCSAILDKDLFPQLASTPYWVKAIFTILSWLPALRQSLLEWMLWIQLQAIYYAHDFHVYHGHVPLIRWWTGRIGPERPPTWAMRLQRSIMYMISRLVMGTCFWIGSLLLGVRGEYPQYTPARDAKE